MQNENASQSDQRSVKLCTVAAGYPMYEEAVAPFVPRNEEIYQGWGYDRWFKKDPEGKDLDLHTYMNINAFTKDGMKQVATLNGITLPNDFFSGCDDDPDYLQKCFIELALLVHKNEKGLYKNVHINFIEGMHRQMAWTHAVYGAKFHPDGLIIPNTLSIQDYEDAEFHLGNHEIKDDDEFRNKIRKRFFEDDNEQFVNIPLSLYYVNQQDVQGEFLSNVFVHVSKLHSESKRDSNTRCPWQTLGVEAEKYVNLFKTNNVLYRPDFTHARFVYPKIPDRDENKVEDDIGKLMDDKVLGPTEQKSTIIETLYPHVNPILLSDEFKKYIRNPYSSEAKTKLMKMLETNAIDGEYNTTNEEEKDRLDGTKDKVAGYPFYPSYKSMTEDVGSEFKEKARMNPMMANNLIHFPLILTILWEAIKNLSRHDTLQDQARMDTIEYYLRFHNVPEDKNTTLNLHGVYNQVYALSPARHMYLSGAEIMGAAHTICQMWNVFVAVQTEPYLNRGKQAREISIQKAGAILKRTFTNIGNTIQSSNNMDVAIILGKRPHTSQF